MIGLGLLLLTGLYLGLFVVAGFRSKSWTDRLLWWVLLLAPFILLTWDMPVGYYRFKTMCEKEGGVRVLEERPAQAKVLRLDADGLFSPGGGLLQDYPTLVAIEAADQKYGLAEPRAYARYERDPDVPAPKTMREKLQFPLKAFKSRLIDRVEERRNRYFTVERGPSAADYVLTEQRTESPIRMAITKFTLRHPDGRVVATSTRIGYSWTNSSNTVFAATRVDECGGPTDGYKPLLNLIAQSQTN